MRLQMLNRFTAVVLLFSTALVTAPVSAAELAAPHASLGSVSGVGPVSLRGVSVAQEGTIFSGDELQVGSKGYAKVMLVAGHRLELGADTKINIRQSEKNIVIQIKSGNVAFTSAGNSQLTLTVGPYEISPEHNSAGNAALIGKDALGLRTIKGKVAVKQTALHTTTVVAKGQEKIMTFAGQTSAPLTQIASTVPGPLPAVPPAPPDPQTSPAGTAGTKGLSKTGWIAVLATLGGAGAAIGILASRSNNNENNAAILARQQLLQTAQTAMSTAQTATSATSTIASATTQLNAAINASNISASQKASLTNQSNLISSAATAIQQQIASLQTQLTTLTTQISSTTDQNAINQLKSQLNGVITQLNAQIAALNQQIASLNALLAQATAAGVQGVPTVNLAPIPPAPTASASVPA